MAPPTLAESDNHQDQQTEASQDAQQEDSLACKTPNERAAYLRRIFRETVQPVHRIDTPVLCGTNPEFAGDILEAYFQYAVFTAQVRSNYDAASRKFYADRRVQDCGKLVLTNAEEKYLRQLKLQNIEVNRVKLVVGTAFKTLCCITLRANNETGEVVARCKPETGEHPELIRFLIGVCDQLNAFRLPNCQVGFTLDDIEQIAGMLYRDPNHEYVLRSKSLRVDSPWMDLDDWGNTGWLDLDAVEEHYLQQFRGNRKGLDSEPWITEADCRSEDM